MIEELNMKPVCFITLVVLFFTGIFAPLEIKAETITAVFPTWEPYGYMEDGKPRGFEIETFAAVAGRMGYDVDFIQQPWKRCLHSMKQGLADVVISALKVQVTGSSICALAWTAIRNTRPASVRSFFSMLVFFIKAKV